MMNIGKHARVLVAALAIGGAVLGLGTGQAEAKTKHPPDDGTRCAYHNPVTGEWEFYMPGDTISVPDRNGQPQLLECGSDGNWILTRGSSGGTNNGVGHQGAYGAP